MYNVESIFIKLETIAPKSTEFFIKSTCQDVDTAQYESVRKCSTAHTLLRIIQHI